MYQYRESGLSNVWLANGYAWVDTTQGKALRIEAPDILANAIDDAVTCKHGRLSGKEFSYLRRSLDLSRSDLAEMFGLSEKTIARWETRNPPVWADRLLRALWSEENDEAFPLISFFEAGTDRVGPTARPRQRLVFTRHGSGNWSETSTGAKRRR